MNARRRVPAMWKSQSVIRGFSRGYKSAIRVFHGVTVSMMMTERLLKNVARGTSSHCIIVS